MNLSLTSDQELLRRSLREFAETELRPHVLEWDEAQGFPRTLLRKFADLGLMGIQFPEEYGGAGMSSVDYCLCIEELARVDPSVCLSVAAHNGLGASHIYMFGSEAQRLQYLVPLASITKPPSPIWRKRTSSCSIARRTEIAARIANALSSSIRKSSRCPAGDAIPLTRASMPSAQSRTYESSNTRTPSTSPR